MNTYLKPFTHKKGIIILIFTAILIILCILSILLGSVNMSISDIISSIIQRDYESTSLRILIYVRLPRTICAILAGSALSVSGVVLQAVLNNTIVSPNILGINAGSGLFALIAIVFFPNMLFLTPVFAFFGAILASSLVYLIGYKAGASKLTIVLSGVAISALLSSITDTIITIYPDAQADKTAFQIGGLSNVTINNAKYTFIYIIISIALCIIFSYNLNVLALGDETAMSLGLNINKTRFLYILLASLLAASSVSIAGQIGFLGLIIPHISKFIIGYDNRYLIPLTAIIGASFLIFCDILARILFAPFEIPVGIVLSFIGSPFFIYLLFRRKRGQND